MSDTQPSAAKPASARQDRPRRAARHAPRPAGNRPAATPNQQNPLLQQLATWYPRLFGDTPLPLKRGIFEDLMSAHPDTLERDALKAALSQHTRSSRYLNGIAAGQQRHDLQGNAVEPMAPEHVLHALLEVFRRRQARSSEDLTPKLHQRLVQAFEASGLSREAYSALLHRRDDATQALVNNALEEAASRAARYAALYRAYSASGQTAEAFADSYGLSAAEVRHMLQRHAPSMP